MSDDPRRGLRRFWPNDKVCDLSDPARPIGIVLDPAYNSFGEVAVTFSGDPEEGVACNPDDLGKVVEPFSPVRAEGTES